MPTLYSHRNTNVSKIWFLVLFVCLFMSMLVWKIYRGIEEIALNTSQMTDSINDLMQDPH